MICTSQTTNKLKLFQKQNRMRYMYNKYTIKSTQYTYSLRCAIIFNNNTICFYVCIKLVRELRIFENE